METEHRNVFEIVKKPCEKEVYCRWCGKKLDATGGQLAEVDGEFQYYCMACLPTKEEIIN